ncbi:caspase family protein [Microseira wollei]|uniref:Peptidase C14 caspase catalytic subunit p20 n=1 Tax=Microseira wollei NIES-4236 TaxID=2530354 RepID=A0AAV3XDG7_9CYAN|nr:caspase family protein [Microseira wollei]GET38865.1 hypothetical protein MiSe_36240 [Microseira wollei NIES-4236]
MDPDPIVVSSTTDNSGLNGTFVPVDGNLPAGYPEQGGVVKDIMGHTLFLLMSAVKSENITVVLDSCFSGGATRDRRVRSRDGGRNIRTSPEEKAAQQMWLSRLNISREDFIKGYRTGVAKGVVLAATEPNQFAIDERLNGFDAGAFTYRLTQALWPENSNVESASAYVREQMPEIYNQTPIYEVKVGSGYERQPLYLINNPRPTANAVVTEVTGNRATLWLGGFDAKGLASLEDGTVLGSVGATGNRGGKVTMRSRSVPEAYRAMV